VKRWRKSGRSGRRAPISCDAVRQAISATFDSEDPGFDAGGIASHLTTCQDCQSFKAEATTLTGHVILQSSRSVPDSLKELLASELTRTVGPPSLPKRRSAWRLRPAIGWRRSVQWAGALAPAAAVAVVIPLGALSGPMGHPTHPKTPCTVQLTSHEIPKVVQHHYHPMLPKEGEVT
jgi:anti-sigma factor RsiW